MLYFINTLKKEMTKQQNYKFVVYFQFDALINTTSSAMAQGPHDTLVSIEKLAIDEYA